MNPTLLLALISLEPAPHCGIERWAVKTAADHAAADIDPTPRRTSVEVLTEKTAPAYSDKNPRSPLELETVTIEADVIGFKIEADEDIHVVIAGKSGQTMIIEFPAPECLQGSHLKPQIEKARSSFLKYFRSPVPKYRKLRKPVHVSITGIPFFDKLHGQIGVAPNGIELHPILKIEKAP